MTETSSTSRRWVVWTLRLGTLLLVALFAGGTARKAWNELGQYEWHVEPGWLVASGALYILGLMPMAWFWQRTLAALRQPTPLIPTLRAYFLGHLAKYIPGKAMTVILRVAAVRRWVPSMRLALISCLMETLTMMAVGACLAAVLTFVVLRSQYWLIAIAAAMAAGAGLPTLPPIARWLARIGAARVKQPDDERPDAAAQVDIDSSLRGLDFKLLAQGWGAAALCWLVLGWSLWATLRGIGVEQISPIDELPRLVASIAFAVVAGFAAMLPGGLGVRDVVLMQLLAPICGDANALVAAILVRLVWLVSEVVACGILYIGAGKKTPN